jgi:hypothetical protein
MARRSSGLKESGNDSTQTLSADELAKQASVGKRPMPDSFDHPPKIRRVGAHRAPKKGGGAWLRVMWVALATVALTAVGIIFVVIGPENLLFPESSNSSQEAQTDEEQELPGITDPATTVTVLNGTTTPGLGDEVAGIITEGSYGTVEFVGNSADQTATISAVFYSDPADEALAKGLGEKLGGIFYYLREDYTTFGTQLVVLIGSDYQSTLPSPSATSGSDSDSDTSDSGESGN